jgi:hypothetical protein
VIGPVAGSDQDLCGHAAPSVRMNVAGDRQTVTTL